MVLSLLPVILFIVFNVYSSSRQEQRHYSLERTSEFSVLTKSYRLKLPFYIGRGFKELSQEQQFVVNTDVENEHFLRHKAGCLKELAHKAAIVVREIREGRDRRGLLQGVLQDTEPVPGVVLLLRFN